MSTANLTRPSIDAVCAFCAFRLGAPSRRSRVATRGLRRSMWTTSTTREASNTAQKETERGGAAKSPGWGAGPGGWGATGGESSKAPERSSEGYSNWGSTATRARQADEAAGDPSPAGDSGGSGGKVRPRPLITKFVAPERPKPYSAHDYDVDRNALNGSKAQTLQPWNSFDRDKREESQPAPARKPKPTEQKPAAAQKQRWKHLKFKQDGEQKQDNDSEKRWQARPRFESGSRTVSWGTSQDPSWKPRFSERPQQRTAQEKDPRTERQSQQAPASAPDQRGRDKRRDRFERFDEDKGNKPAEYESKKSRDKKGRNRGFNEPAVSDEVVDRMERREQRKAERKAKKESGPPTPIILPNFISIGNLAAALRVRIEEFNARLRSLGFEDFSNDHVLNAEDAGLIAQEFNFEPMSMPAEETQEDIVALAEPSAEERDSMPSRPPVITIMGHVDHGKTTLLDYLRSTSVAAGEHGGITQHIGAFTVPMPSGRTITFLDTPGHAAFLDMRARGANVTDIVILVVAADDSVKPQTLEAIKHAKSAGVPMIVAISKVDKDGADVERVKRDLAQHGVEVEDFGGDVQAIPVSGKTGQGMTDLEDAAIALADILDVRADTEGQVEGWVLESSIKPQGKVATVLVRRGTLRAGQIIVAGQTWAKIRTVRNEAGQAIEAATPGTPVEIDGWDTSPDAGAEVLQAESVSQARGVAERRQDAADTERQAEAVAATNEQRSEARAARGVAREQSELDDLKKTNPQRAAELQVALDMAKANEARTGAARFVQVPLVVRADVAGSVEALEAAVLAIGNTEIRTEVLRADVGAVSESDVELAATARGCIVSFGVPVDNAMKREAEKEGVPVIEGNIIYRITDEVKELLEERLPKIYSHKVLGEAEIAQVFMYTFRGKGKVPVAGCKVRNGVVDKTKHVKVLRAGKVVFEGMLDDLKHHKKDVTEIRKGSDCGMSFEGFTEFEAGDQVQCYDIIEEKRTL